MRPDCLIRSHIYMYKSPVLKWDFNDQINQIDINKLFQMKINAPAIQWKKRGTASAIFPLGICNWQCMTLILARLFSFGVTDVSLALYTLYTIHHIILVAVVVAAFFGSVLKRLTDFSNTCKRIIYDIDAFWIGKKYPKRRRPHKK